VSLQENSPITRDDPRWSALPTPTQAKQWEEVAPGTFNRIMIEVERG
jgi:uncharacterized membrane protein